MVYSLILEIIVFTLLAYTIFYSRRKSKAFKSLVFWDRTHDYYSFCIEVRIRYVILTLLINYQTRYLYAHVFYQCDTANVEMAFIHGIAAFRSNLTKLHDYSASLFLGTRHNPLSTTEIRDLMEKLHGISCMLCRNHKHWSDACDNRAPDGTVTITTGHWRFGPTNQQQRWQRAMAFISRYEAREQYKHLYRAALQMLHELCVFIRYRRN